MKHGVIPIQNEEVNSKYFKERQHELDKREYELKIERDNIEKNKEALTRLFKQIDLEEAGLNRRSESIEQQEKELLKRTALIQFKENNIDKLIRDAGKSTLALRNNL